MAELFAPPGAARVWQVEALLQAIGDVLAGGFGACTVRGEIAGFTRAGSGHCYFSLKDADGGAALIRCAMFRRAANLLDFLPRDGQQVEVRGRVAVYEPRGELQFVVEAMQQAGAGALYEQFLRLKARLAAEGLFDAGRKRALPTFPLAVGIVTSLDAAALRDVASALARRAPHVRAIVYPSPVQGSEAPAALAAAIAAAGRHAAVQVLILCRGGGSMEDLWAFNDERVVRAVVASPIPVVCGVGHATDTSLADFAADLSAPTPTAAAELAVPVTQDCRDELAALQQRLTRRVQRALEQQGQRLDAALLRLARPLDLLRRQSQRLALLDQRLRQTPARRCAEQRQHLEQIAQRLRRAVRVRQQSAGQRLAADAARLAALDPRAVLLRGYAWLADNTGQPLSSVHRLRIDQSLRAVLADGELDARITDIRAG